MRGSGSPTSISTTRLPAKAVVTSTVADGSGRTSPENSRILSPGVCVSAKSPASAHSAATTARNCPSLAMWRGSSPSNSHAPRTVSRTGIFADHAEGETHVNQHPIPRDWFFVLDQPKVYAPAHTRDIDKPGPRSWRESAWISMRSDPDEKSSGSSRASAESPRMANLGLCPRAARNPPAKACTLNRLSRGSMA